jgi:hypothetical protein
MHRQSLDRIAQPSLHIKCFDEKLEPETGEHHNAVWSFKHGKCSSQGNCEDDTKKLALELNRMEFNTVLEIVPEMDFPIPTCSKSSIERTLANFANCQETSMLKLKLCTLTCFQIGNFMKYAAELLIIEWGCSGHIPG